MPSGAALTGPGAGGRSNSPPREESGGGHGDENGVDDSAAFNAELDRIAAEKEQVSSEAWMSIRSAIRQEAHRDSSQCMKTHIKKLRFSFGR